MDTLLTFFMALMYFVFPGHVFKIQVDGKSVKFMIHYNYNFKFVFVFSKAKINENKRGIKMF